MFLDLGDDPEPPNDLPQIDFSKEPDIKPTVEHYLSLNALNGATCFGVIRFKGFNGPIHVSILLDGGSSASFVQPQIVYCLGLPVEPTEKCNVLVGNGQNMKAEGIVQNLTVKVQGNDITVPAYLLPVWSRCDTRSTLASIFGSACGLWISCVAD